MPYDGDVAVSCGLTISGQLYQASVTERVDSGLIPSRMKTNTIKIGIDSFPA